MTTDNKYQIIKISEFGHKVLDKKTKECIWDIFTGSCVFTLNEARAILRKAQEK